MKGLNLFAMILLVIGAINWGLVGLFDFNLVSALFGLDSWFSNLIYILVGIAGIWGIYLMGPLQKGTDRTTHSRRTPPPETR